MYEPETRTLYPTAVVPSSTLAPPVVSERGRVVEYREYAGMLLPVFEAPPAPVEVRTVVVHRGVDPRAQILGAGGVFAAGTGWGISQALTAFDGISVAALMWLAIAIAAWRIGPALRRRDTHNTVTNHNQGWFSRSHTTTGGR